MEIKITVAIITSLASIIVAIFTTWRSYAQSKKIELLKNEMEVKKIKDEQIFKYMLSYNAEQINQYFIHLKQFLQ
jgi:hypothetical protein